MPERDLLMIPGPTMVDPAVLRAISAPVVAYNSPEFVEIAGSSLEDLRWLLGGPNGKSFAFAGSGTLALEWAAVNWIEPGDKVLVLVVGYFGVHFQQIAACQGADLTVLHSAPGDTVPLDQVEAALKQGGYKLLEVTHVDTSTGVMNDIPALAQLAHRYGALLMVDGVCAAGGMDVQCDAWGVDVYMTGSQKALGMPPGMGIAWAGARAIAVATARKTRTPSFYLDLKSWLVLVDNLTARRGAGFLHTPPINMYYALREALNLIKREGLEKRIQRHALLSRAYKAGIEAMGLKPVPVRPEVAAPTLTCTYYPPGVDGALIPRVKAQGVTIAIGFFTPPVAPYFRVGHMGTVTASDVLATLGAIETALRALEHDVEPGASAAAALRVLAA
ncbi:MAG: alanine--glyoxylate aminotransferase family protein [Chloroflexi bacterium]|nr:alanine--glyoxylate aminotransferase family protein [Chloroflexota bacterium]